MISVYLILGGPDDFMFGINFYDADGNSLDMRPPLDFDFTMYGEGTPAHMGDFDISEDDVAHIGVSLAKCSYVHTLKLSSESGDWIKELPDYGNIPVSEFYYEYQKPSGDEGTGFSFSSLLEPMILVMMVVMMVKMFKRS